MPQMDVDIRKPVSHDFGITRPSHSGTTTTSDDDDDSDSDDEEAVATHHNGESSAEAERRRNGWPLALPTDIEDQTVDHAAEDDAYPIYDSEDEDDEDRLAEARRVGGLAYYQTLASTSARAAARNFVTFLHKITPRQGSVIPPNARLETIFGSGPITTKRFRAPKGKKIYVPVRVEPKVYFAAERTFLGWVRYCAHFLHFGIHCALTGTIPALLRGLLT
jgi:hypothetical protein